MIRSNEPKVFGDGSVTVCLSQDKLRLFIGQKEIENIDSVSFDSLDSNRLEVYFPNSGENENLQAIEEDVRVCTLVPWITVTKLM